MTSRLLAGAPSLLALSHEGRFLQGWVLSPGVLDSDVSQIWEKTRP